jgi:Rrf2 family protein
MNVSQKCQYALRALFELSLVTSGEPVRIADIAESQAIPGRFLEVILAQLKNAGFVASRRGKEGGYLLARPAASITVGDVVRFVDGPIHPVKCLGEQGTECLFKGDCAFAWVWDKAAAALDAVYDTITLADLVEHQRQAERGHVVDFII